MEFIFCSGYNNIFQIWFSWTALLWDTGMALGPVYLEVICILWTLVLPQEICETTSLLHIDSHQFAITKWNIKYFTNDSSFILMQDSLNWDGCLSSGNCFPIAKNGSWSKQSVVEAAGGWWSRLSLPAAVVWQQSPDCSRFWAQLKYKNGTKSQNKKLSMKFQDNLLCTF